MTRPATTTEIKNALIVLGKIATADQWAAKPDPAMAVTWAECFAVHDLGLPDLMAAVIALYADETRDKANRTLPADVIRYARPIRRQRAEREKITGTIDREALSERRRAIDACTLCDPNGWIDTPDCLTRCNHQQQLN